MTSEQLNFKLMESLCKEFQSVWALDLSDLSMKLHSSNESIDLPEYLEDVPEKLDYNTARVWYAENIILAQHRERIISLSSIENVIKMTEGGKPYYLGYARTRQGKINYNQLCFDLVCDDEGRTEYVLIGFRDIDERKNADVDNVTGLLTRDAFFRRADELLKLYPEKTFDLTISDIIDFKDINEVYGIDTADDILGWMGEFLAPVISENVVIGRYGSDQMVLMGTHDIVKDLISQEGMDNFLAAERNNGLPSIKVKFGVYTDVRHNSSIITSCDKAHAALNTVKAHYKNLIAYYNNDIEHQMYVTRKIEGSMRDSLENGDFKVYYQPKHDAVTGKLCGAEALVRWIHPDYGFMSPNDFIPLFEKNEFVVEVDGFVWRRTCENIRRWTDMGLKVVPVSVNASKLTFMQNNFLAKIQKAVRENNINPKMMHIEITETLMTENVDDLVMKLAALRAIGYGIELDDFGAGYSSLNVLSTLPIDTVKLDMSFIKQFDNEKRIKVLAACISLARELGYNTISEGVELREQSAILEALGVDMIQGFLFSHPLSEEEFEKYMAE